MYRDDCMCDIDGIITVRVDGVTCVIVGVGACVVDVGISHVVVGVVYDVVVSVFMCGGMYVVYGSVGVGMHGVVGVMIVDAGVGRDWCCALVVDGGVYGGGLYCWR